MEFQVGIQFPHHNFFTVQSAVLESTINGNPRKVNIGDICVANPVDIIETEIFPTNNWGEPNCYRRVLARLKMANITNRKQIHATGKSSKLDDIGFHMENQVEKAIMSSKTTPVCHSSSKSVLGVKLSRVYDHEDTWTTKNMQMLEDFQPPRNPYATVQAAEVDVKPSSCKTPPRRVPDIQNADKPSNLVASGLHIESLTKILITL